MFSYSFTPADQVVFAACCGGSLSEAVQALITILLIIFRFSHNYSYQVNCPEKRLFILGDAARHGQLLSLKIDFCALAAPRWRHGRLWIFLLLEVTMKGAWAA